MEFIHQDFFQRPRIQSLDIEALHFDDCFIRLDNNIFISHGKSPGSIRFLFLPADHLHDISWPVPHPAGFHRRER